MDVKEGDWYCRAVSYIAARGITSGTGIGKFSPEARFTRGQFIVMMMKAFGMEPDQDSMDNFADAGNTWYTGYLASAKRLGISSGIGGNRFGPEQGITRQEAFTMLYKALRLIGKLPEGASSGRTLPSFVVEGDIAPWAREAMEFLVETGIAMGSGERLHPESRISRAEMAQVLYNLLGRK